MRHMGIFMKRLAVKVISAVILVGVSARGDVHVTNEWLKDDYTKKEVIIPMLNVVNLCGVISKT